MPGPPHLTSGCPANASVRPTAAAMTPTCMRPASLGTYVLTRLEWRWNFRSSRRTPRGRGMHSGDRASGRLHPNRVGTYVRARRVAPRCRTRRPIGPERNRVDRGDVEPCHGLRPGVARVRPCYALDLTSRLKRMGRRSTSVMAGSPADPALVTLYPRTLDVPDTQLLHPVRDHRGSLSGTWDRITWAR